MDKKIIAIFYAEIFCLTGLMSLIHLCVFLFYIFLKIGGSDILFPYFEKRISQVYIYANFKDSIVSG